MTRDEAIEAAAEAIRAAVVSEGDIPESTTTWQDYQPDAAAALAAALPVLLNDLADRIEADAPSADNGTFQSPEARNLRIIRRGGYQSAVALVRAAAEGWGA